MSKPSEYQRVETAVQIARPLAIVVFGLWLGGRFVVKKLAALVARLCNSLKANKGQ